MLAHSISDSHEIEESPENHCSLTAHMHIPEYEKEGDSPSSICHRIAAEADDLETIYEEENDVIEEQLEDENTKQASNEITSLFAHRLHSVDTQAEFPEFLSSAVSHVHLPETCETQEATVSSLAHQHSELTNDKDDSKTESYASLMINDEKDDAQLE